MDTLQIVFGILLIIVSLGLIVVVMLQDSKQDGLSAIAGQSAGIGATRAKNLRYEAMLKKLTIALAAVFVVLALVLFGLSNKSTATVPANSGDTNVTVDTTGDEATSDVNAAVTDDASGEVESTADTAANTGDAEATN